MTMTIPIVEDRERLEGVSRHLCFDRKGAYGAGYAFACDELGKPELTNPCARENYERVTGPNAHEYDPPYVHTRKWSYWTIRVGRCHCGRRIELDRFTNTCECGRDYDSGGNLLAPREQWGEETGESAGDVLAGDTDPWSGE
jgi:hypothetical protein